MGRAGVNVAVRAQGSLQARLRIKEKSLLGERRDSIFAKRSQNVTPTVQYKISK